MIGRMPRARRAPSAGRPGALRAGLRLASGLKVGLYGGTFDPPHEGHRHVAEEARRRLGLDRVIWLVTPGNPLKTLRPTSRLAERLALARRGVRGPTWSVSDIETRIGSRYTVDTVRWFKARYPAVRFVWIMGADSLASFHLWKGWADLAAEVPIAVISRPHVALRSRFSPMARRFARARLPVARAAALATSPPPAWIYIPAPFRFVSSTALRNSDLKMVGVRAMEGTDFSIEAPPDP
jgi:nicotinate-nucleotide adenylyltransferase